MKNCCYRVGNERATMLQITKSLFKLKSGGVAKIFSTPPPPTKAPKSLFLLLKVLGFMHRHTSFVCFLRDAGNRDNKTHF